MTPTSLLDSQVAGQASPLENVNTSGDVARQGVDPAAPNQQEVIAAGTGTTFSGGKRRRRSSKKSKKSKKSIKRRRSSRSRRSYRRPLFLL